ncbi:4-hydroxy-tetrahydrodipicolinate reductase [Lysinibacter cavernae]|uniref:4-hydroxy-tetrahydrodipicolinate reductase n=1 Tax=Lysinibacter cavernae TaxID=1640652 RepID=A0A7X5QYB5_9MICO|nr:4-hydroxy-tetrahydrodipicolinate reductase [Lysinibacter cavernae]NIH52188.1 4-hydroxy-tetrahydrodipicolinate reductase [Lysinibacter cavernae]
MTTRVAIAGASGRMGRLARSIVNELDGFAIHAELGSQTPLSDMLGADVVIDVTTPAVSPAVVSFAVENGINVLVGTSGWSADRLAQLRTQLVTQPNVGIVVIPNFSIGSVLGTALSTIAGQFFDSIEIIEAHHAGKIDSPSGTAVRTAELIAAARGDRGPVEAPFADQIARGEQVASIPIHSLRMAGVLAKQEVILGGTGEVLTITHDTISPEAYSTGMRAALKAVTTATGLTVGLDQVLGLDFSKVRATPDAEARS